MMRKEVEILGVIAVVVVICALFGASFYRKSVESERLAATSGNSSKTAIPPEVLIRPDSWTLGAADAPVTIVEFYDPECESCAAFAPIVKKVLKDYDGRARFVARYMPLHPNSLSAATFTEAAGEQGKYWEAMELLFQKQPEWGTKHGANAGPPADINALFRKYAEEMGLDMNKMNAAFAENRYKVKTERDKKDGETLGVRQTPTLFVNGRKLMRLNEADLKSMIDEELKR